jgi:acetyltransferase
MKHMISGTNMGTLVVASAGADPQAEQVIAQRDSTDKGVAFLWTGTRGATAGLPKLKEARIPIFYVPDKLAQGLKALQNYHNWRDRRLEEGFGVAPEISPEQQATLDQFKGLDRFEFSEHESKGLISAWGVPVTVERTARSAEEAVAAAQEIGFPVALKVDSPDILHKTEAGVLRLGLSDPGQVRAAYAEVMANAARFAPAAAASGVLVQEMVPGGVEVIVGVTYDPQLGPMLLFGTGGIMVEIYNDVALRRCPITPSEAQEMIAQVKGARLLQGFRGQPEADIEALADTLVRVSHLAANLEGRLAELDINPLMVLPRGQGVKAADALVVFQS